MKKSIKRLWNNLASLRDYDVQNAIKNKEPIIITRKDTNETMTLSVNDLKIKGFSTNSRSFPSKHGTPPYKLIDYRWVSNSPDTK